MSFQDPDPADTPGLEPGGGVPPGETPPGEGAISAVAHHDERPPSKWIGRVMVGVIGLVVLLVAGFMLVRVVFFATE